jgi:hypothetical protein
MSLDAQTRIFEFDTSYTRVRIESGHRLLTV